LTKYLNQFKKPNLMVTDPTLTLPQGEGTDQVAISSPPLEGLGEVNNGKSELRGVVTDPTLTLPQGEGTVQVEISSSPLEGLEEVSEGSGEVYITSSKEQEEVIFGYNTANPLTYSIIKDYRENLKANPTEAEKVAWKFLRNKQTGHKIRRQHVIDDFITDFVCLLKKVVIEIDGKIHEFHKDYDSMRTYRLNELGYKVIRFSNEEVIANPKKVAERIKVILDQQDTNDPTLTLPQGEGTVQVEISSPPLEGLGEVSDWLGKV